MVFEFRLELPFAMSHQNVRFNGVDLSLENLFMDLETLLGNSELMQAVSVVYGLIIWDVIVCV